MRGVQPGEIDYKYDMTIARSTRRIIINRGGKGSGHFDHEGRPGKRGGSAPGGRSQALMEELDRWEQANFGKKETARVFDPDGTIRLTRQGTKSTIKYTGPDIPKLKGAIVSHNHPNGAAISTPDIGAFFQGQSLEMRTVGERICSIRWTIEDIPPRYVLDEANQIFLRTFAKYQERYSQKYDEIVSRFGEDDKSSEMYAALRSLTYERMDTTMKDFLGRMNEKGLALVYETYDMPTPWEHWKGWEKW